MAKLFVGIDVSLRELRVCCLEAPDGEPRCLLQFSTTNDLPGATALVQKTVALLQTAGLSEVLVGVESTSVYGFHLTQHLLQAAELAPFQPRIYAINPARIKAFKKSYGDLPKTDAVDAWLIADFLRFRRLPKPVVDMSRYLPLQQLTRQRFHLVETIVAEQARCWNHLFLKCSAIAQDKPFDSRPFGATAQAVFAEFATPDELASTSLEQLVALLESRSRGRLMDPDCVAATLQKAARSSYRLPKATADAVNLALATSLHLIRELQAQVKRLDAAIAEQLSIIPGANCLLSVRGIGPVYAAGILGEIGPIHRFSGHPALAKFAGLVWSRHQSGPFEAEDRRLLKSGNRYLRYYLVEAANSLRVHDAEYKRFYQAKYAEVTKHAHKRALALTARKLVRLVDALLRSNRLYRPRTRVEA